MEPKHLYTTYYREKDGKFVQDINTQLWAKNMSDAVEIAEQRNMGEIVEPPSIFSATIIIDLPSELFKEGKIIQALHAACWLGSIACSANVITGKELLGDNGIIHGLTHLLLDYDRLTSFGKRIYDLTKLQMYDMLVGLQMKTPGFDKPKSSFDLNHID